MFIFVLISGIVVWIPRTAKAWKNSFKISVNKGWRRFWYDLHIAGGLYTFLFLLVMSLTGLTWSFGWYRTGFYKVFGVETTQGTSHHGALSQTTEKEKGHRGEKNERGDAGNPNRKEGKEDDREGHRKSNGEQSPYTSWQGVYEQLKAQNPGYRQITVSNGTATVSFLSLIHI